jgi:hypothetical protein
MGGDGWSFYVDGRGGLALGREIGRRVIVSAAGARRRQEPTRDTAKSNRANAIVSQSRWKSHVADTTAITI